MATAAPLPYSKREQRAWYFYDWANSAFSTTVVTLFLGPYLTALAKSAAGPDGLVSYFGLRVAPQSVWAYSVSLSVCTQVIGLPLFGAIADYGHRKREILALLAWLGAAATMAMYLLHGGRYFLGVVLFLIANLTFGAAMVVYKAFLPEIAPASERDAVSARGWGLGYLGGGLLLALNLLLYTRSSQWGLSESMAVRISLFSAGLWWAAFTVIPVLRLRNRVPAKTPPPGTNYLTAGLRQLGHTLSEVRRYRHTLLFLAAYLIYNDGIQTVFTMAAQFGSEELHLSMGTLTASILLAQFVGILGALAFDRLARRTGNKRAVMLALLVWTAVLFYAWLGVRSAWEFNLLSAVVGAVMGGSQALSRSIYSFLIPKGKEAEYFSIYEVSDKGTSWLGPLLFGLALQWTGNFRLAIFSLIVFFLAGLALLARVDVRGGAIAAGNEPPPR